MCGVSLLPGEAGAHRGREVEGECFDGVHLLSNSVFYRATFLLTPKIEEILNPWPTQNDFI